MRDIFDENPTSPVPETKILAAPTIVSGGFQGGAPLGRTGLMGQARSHPVIPCHTPGGTACCGCRSQGPRAMDPEDHKVASITLRWCCVTPPGLVTRPIRSGIPMNAPQCTGDDSVASGLLQGHRRPWCLSLLAGYRELRLRRLLDPN